MLDHLNTDECTHSLVYNSRLRKQIIEKIDKLSSTEHHEIFKIMKRNNIQYTCNNNGIFINFTFVKDAIVCELDQFIDFCIQNRKMLDEYDMKLNECKITRDYETLRQTDGNLQSQLPEEDTTSVMNSVSLDKHFRDAPQIITSETWMTMIQTTKEEENIRSLLKMLQIQTEKTSKKKVNTKFNVAKKKYSRRVVSEAAHKKFDEINNFSLQAEAYVI